MTIRIQNRTALVQQVPVAMPGDYEILVRVKAIAINPTDWKRASATVPFTLAPVLDTPLTDLKFICSKSTPLTPPPLSPPDPRFLFPVDVGTICGADYAGEVVKVGPRQDPSFSLKVGDRVAGIVHGGEREMSSRKQVLPPRSI